MTHESIETFMLEFPAPAGTRFLTIVVIFIVKLFLEVGISHVSSCHITGFLPPAVVFTNDRVFTILVIFLVPAVTRGLVYKGIGVAVNSFIILMKL